MTPPPEYTIRVSSRAKNVSLRVTPHKGLEVVIPPKYKIKKIPKLLKKQRDWIEKHLARIADIPEPTLPDVLQLRAINETWDIDYVAVVNDRFKLIPNPQNKLTVMGDITNYESCKIVTYKWLQQKAKEHLIPWLNNLSSKIGLDYNNVSIRSQKTRWGSCSTRKNINLNCQLLLLPPPLVDYVIIHELCHTEHHNHSAKFWKLVATHQPDYCTLRKKLRQYRL